MNEGLLVSIIICSQNRSADLSECLSALIPQVDPRAEVILVDSASNPDESAKMAQLSTLYPATKLTRVDAPGLSLARNAGVALAKAEWVVFLDDDAVPFPDWLEKLLAAVINASAIQAVMGGAIHPLWPQGLSGEHLSKRWKTFLSIAEADKPGSVAEGYDIHGANYAVRRKVLLDLGGFSERLGRIGSRLLSGDESQVTQSVLDAGLGAGFDPSFKVYHKIGRERLALSWILRRTFWEGFSIVRIFRSRGLPPPPHLRPLKLIASLPALLFFSLVQFQNHDWKIRLSMCIGACVSRLSARDPNPSPKAQKLADRTIAQ